MICRGEEQTDDPILGQFLTFLAQDIQHNPQHVNTISTALLDKVQSLITNVDTDLNKPLSEKDECNHSAPKV